jgi:hypothetical protein
MVGETISVHPNLGIPSRMAASLTAIFQTSGPRIPLGRPFAIEHLTCGHL